MKIADLYKGRVKFVRYQNGELWYRHEDHDFEFPVPTYDTGEGIFLPEDKASYFLRWMRPQLALIEEGRAESASVD